MTDLGLRLLSSVGMAILVARRSITVPRAEQQVCGTAFATAAAEDEQPVGAACGSPAYHGANLFFLSEAQHGFFVFA